MTSAPQSREVTNSVPANVLWPTLESGQPVPAMPMSLSSVLLGLHVIQGVMATFQLPGFIQTLSKNKPNGHGDRLFTLPPNVINVDDFKRITPRKRHLKPKKLLKRLDKDFDPFWMSIDLPDDLLQTHIKRRVDSTLFEEVRTLNFTALERTLQAKYGSDNGSGDGGGEDVGENSNNDIAENIKEAVTSWLVTQASCPVYYRWEDLGLLYWPRWVRRGMCSLKSDVLASLSAPSQSPSSSSIKHQDTSCSWPPGMHCIPAKAKRLRILRWQCRNNKALNNFNRFRKNSKKKPRSLKAASPSVNDREQSLLAHNTNAFNKLSAAQKKKFRQFEKGTNLTLAQILKMSTFTGVHARKANKDNHMEPSDIEPKEKIPKTPTKNDCKDSDEGNDTENWNRLSWKERRRKLNVKCKWIKIPYPVTDDCYCSC